MLRAHLQIRRLTSVIIITHVPPPTHTHTHTHISHIYTHSHTHSCGVLQHNTTEAPFLSKNFVSCKNTVHGSISDICSTHKPKQAFLPFRLALTMQSSPCTHKDMTDCNNAVFSMHTQGHDWLQQCSLLHAHTRKHVPKLFKMAGCLW